MSDIVPEVAPVVEAPPAPVNPLETPAPVTTPESAADPFDDEKVQTFERKYVEKIRKEAADRRTAAKKYEDAFGQYSDEEQAVWLGLAQELTTDPKSVAAKFQQIANEILGGSIPEAPAAPVPAEGTPDKPLTQADIERILSERDSAAQQDRDVAEATKKVVDEAVALGYTQGSSEWRELMFLARYEADGDLTKAHGLREDRNKAAVEAYLAEKSGQGGIPVAKGGGGDTPSQTQPITTWTGAADALRAALEAK